jgi:RsiW-degrading membrane proteinase PrsW (M82 family)
MMRDSGAHYLHPAPQPVQPVWTGEVRPSRAGPIVLAVAGILLGGIALLVVFVYLATFLGTGGLLVSLALALVPLAAVLFAVRWIDRWDPEPRPALWFAFLWGAGVSIVTALLFDLGVQLAVLAVSGRADRGDSPGSAFLSAVVQAPIVEEAAKGFGILLLFWGLRKHFDGPVDGVVFAATIAAGFAFTENIQYFGVALAEGGLGSLGLTFVVRGLFSPFAHVMFTACTGFALGIAAGRVGPLGAVGYYLAGLVPATLLHALWNGAFTLFAADSSLIAYYLLVQVPLFLGAIVVVVLIRRHEVRVTVQRLGDYVAAGYFTPAEVAMLATPAGRRQARAWAATQAPAKGAAMRRFITDATRLAFARNRVINGSASQVNRADESALLGRVLADRAAVLG